MFARRVIAWSTIVIAVFLTASGGTSAQAQQAPQAAPELVPTPAPAPDKAASPARETYDSLQAGQDAQAMAERQRREAVDRQLQTQADIRYYQVVPGPWGRYYARRYGLPYVRAYAPPVAVQEAQRAIESGYLPVPPLGPWPMPGDFFAPPFAPFVGEPYVDSVEQPQGHEKVWTGPNSYIYRPRQQEPTRAQREPTLAPPQAAEPAAAELPGEQPPAALPSLNPPEQEPKLNPVPGPREF